MNRSMQFFVMVSNAVVHLHLENLLNSVVFNKVFLKIAGLIILRGFQGRYFNVSLNLQLAENNPVIEELANGQSFRNGMSLLSI